MRRHLTSQSLLRIAPAVALLVIASVGGAYALTHREPAFSPLDGAQRATIGRPAPSTVLDKSWMADFDVFMDERLPGRDRMLEAHAAVTSRGFRDPVLNNVYLRGPFGQLLEKPPVLDIRDSLAEEAQAVTRVAPDVPTLFVYAPRKEELYPDGYPEAWSSDYPRARNAIVDAWSGAGPVLDLTPSMQSRADRGIAYFATDHHWTPDTAREAAGDILARLSELGVSVGQDSREYRENTADRPFFGSTGRLVTSGATTPDVFAFPVPQGGFNATMCVDGECGLPTLDMSIVNAPAKYANRYAGFIGGDNGLVEITNDSPTAEGTVILLKDSYGNALATYLAERVERLIVIDERHYTGIPLDALAEQVNPDAVLVVHNPLSLLSESFNTHVWTDRADVSHVEPQLSGHTLIATSQGLVMQTVPHQPLDSSLADDAKVLAEAIDATGVPQFWFYAPRKEQVFADLFPEGVENPVAKNGPPALAYMREAHEITDLTALVSDPLTRDGMYFRTDHHWTVDGARLAARAITDELVAAGVPLGTDDREWHRVQTPLPFYGTELRDLPASIQVPPDEFWYDEPEGGFRSRVCDVACTTPLVDKSYLTDPARDANRFRSLLGTPAALVHIHNDDPAANGVIVMLKDSYGNPVAMRLAEQAKDLYLVDERKWDSEPLGRFIARINPDAVVFLHNHVSVLSQEFNREVWRTAGD